MVFIGYLKTAKWFCKTPQISSLGLYSTIRLLYGFIHSHETTHLCLYAIPYNSSMGFLYTTAIQFYGFIEYKKTTLEFENSLCLSSLVNK